MKHIRYAAIALATLVLAACSTPQDTNLESDTIIVTAGHMAHADTAAVRQLGVLHATTVAGSTTTQISLNEVGCSAFAPMAVTISYRIAGDLESPASFDVFTSWIYDGEGFVGSDPVTVLVPAGGSPIPSVDIQVAAAATATGRGSATLRVEPHNIVTDRSVEPARQLQLSANSSARVRVDLTDCSEVNTPPSITVPSDIVVIATNIDGAFIDYMVTADDKEDGDLTARVTCNSFQDGTVVGRSGDAFQIGVRDVVCTVTDSGGLTASASFIADVTLDVDPACGFLTPLRAVAPYSAHRINSTVPHKVCPPAYADGTLATDLAEGLHFALNRRPLGDTTADAETVDIAAAGSTIWRWDEKAGHYIYNLKTSRTWSTGDYETAVSFNGVVLADTFFVLR